MATNGVSRNLDSYEDLRKLNIPLDTEPAITFRPSLPGKQPAVQNLAIGDRAIRDRTIDDWTRSRTGLPAIGDRTRNHGVIGVRRSRSPITRFPDCPILYFSIVAFLT
jgi:hypothetical protein